MTIGEATNLTNVITEHFAADNAMAIVEKMSGQPSSSFAKLARYVFEAANNNDKVAVSIVKEGADYVSKLAQRLLENNPPRLSMIGGLAEPLNKWLAEDIAKRVESPIQPPEMGAVYFAQQSVLEQNQEVSL